MARFRDHRTDFGGVIAMWIAACLLIGQISVRQEGEVVQREQLVRLIEEAWRPIHDLEFTYEGTSTSLRHKDQATPDPRGMSFQGAFAIRSDSSIHIELFAQPADLTKALQHKIWTLLDGQAEERHRVADRPDAAGNRDRKSRGSSGSLNRPYSPLRFVLLPGLLEHLKAPEVEFRCLGWEEVSGHRCLAIELASLPREPAASRLIDRYWIDLNRGCHPIRRELVRGETPWLTSLDIELAELPGSDGSRIWIPRSGRFHSYASSPTQVSNDPTFEETYSVVADTVRLNQNLPDSVFSLDHSSIPKSAKLVTLKTNFDASRKSAPFHAAQSAADLLLAEADRQSAQLEASAPTRESWVRRNGVALAVFCGGALALAIAGYWRHGAA